MRPIIKHPCWQQGVEGCPEEITSACDKLDLVVVTTLGNGSVWASAKAALNSALTDIAGTTTDYRYGLVSVDAAGNVTVEEALALNNLTAVTTAVTALSDGTNPGQSPTDEYAHDINGGLQEAINSGGAIGTWRTGADVSRQIVVLSDLLPGGNNDTHSSTDEDEFTQAATDGWNDHQIETNVLRGHLWTGTYLLPVLETQVDAIYQAAAAAGRGSFAAALLGSSVLYATFRQLVELQCYQDGSGYETLPHLHCCKRGVCRLCLEQVCYDTTHEGSAVWDGDSYNGTINDSTVDVYWALRDACYLFVEVDGVVVYAEKKCTGDNTLECESIELIVDDVVTGTYDTCTADLSIRTYQPVRLRRKQDDGCATHFCGKADCTCEEMCVTITEDAGSDCAGVWPSVLYDACELGTDSPYWEGTSACGDSTEYTGWIRMKPDDYTNECVMYGEITDSDTGTTYELPETEVDGGQGSVATWQLAGRTVTAKCQVCESCGTSLICCECRFDDLMELTQTLVSGGDACSIGTSGPITTTLGNGSVDPSIFPDKRWNDGECIHYWVVTYDIAPAPGCSNVDPSRVVVLVQRDPEGDAHPLIDGTIAANCEWYLLIYDTSYNWISTNYTYAECCHNRNLGPASSHLKWLDFDNTDWGYKSLTYDLLFNNIETIASFGTTCEEG